MPRAYTVDWDKVSALAEVLENPEGIEVPETWVKEVRDHLTIVDEHGVTHVSILCHSFVCTMCDFCQAIDDTAVFGELKHPDRRWPVENEKPGVVNCISCLGV